MEYNIFDYGAVENGRLWERGNRSRKSLLPGAREGMGRLAFIYEA